MSRKKHFPTPSLSTEHRRILKDAPNIYLIGLMGAGKSTVGRILANALQRPFVDSDDEIVSRTGAAIATIFEIEGESGFRDRESRVIGELTEKKGIVMATGGGAILREENRQVLQNNGWVVYLSTSPERLMQRVKRDKSRPLLQNVDPLATLRNLHNVRHPLYQSIAHMELTTGTGQVSHVAEQIIQALVHHMNQQTHRGEPTVTPAQHLAAPTTEPTQQSHEAQP